MDKLLHGRVTAIALGTRSWAESRAYRTNYNPEDLEGWCAIASAELHKRLKAEEIPAEIHMWVSGFGECHCFCVVEDHVVDVTATQFKAFKLKTVVIMHKKEAEAFEYYTTTNVFTSAAQLRRFQKREHWPSNQIAFA
jgi:hypothetical protein